MITKLKFTGERVVPWAPSMRRRPDLVHHHLQRYVSALTYITGKTVIDLGCGTGYGAFIMSFLAERVMGFDVDDETVQFARQNFGHWAEFFNADLDEEAFLLPGAEVYTAFEILEHLEYPERVIEQITGAALLWSLPINAPSPYHRRVYSLTEALDFLPGPKFYQHPKNGYVVPVAGARFQPKHILGVYDAR